MAVREIVKYGDLILRKQCGDVEDIFSVLPLVEDMFDTMYEEEGIGLAANQVGFDMNLMIIDVSHTDEVDEAHIFVNGQILDSFGESELEEGCLSIPEIRLPIKRPESIRFKYQLPDGSDQVEEFSGLLARAIQHEVDHLKGVFIIDRVSHLMALQYKKKLKQIKMNSNKSREINTTKESFVL